MVSLQCNHLYPCVLFACYVNNGRTIIRLGFVNDYNSRELDTRNSTSII